MAQRRREFSEALLRKQTRPEYVPPLYRLGAPQYTDSQGRQWWRRPNNTWACHLPRDNTIQPLPSEYITLYAENDSDPAPFVSIQVKRTLFERRRTVGYVEGYVDDWEEEEEDK